MDSRLITIIFHLDGRINRDADGAYYDDESVGLWWQSGIPKCLKFLFKTPKNTKTLRLKTP